MFTGVAYMMAYYHIDVDKTYDQGCMNFENVMCIFNNTLYSSIRLDEAKYVHVHMTEYRAFV